MGIKIRDAKKEDIEAIKPMLEKFSAFYDSKIEVFPNTHEATIILGNLIESHVFIVAEDEESKALVGLVAGFGIRHFLNPSIKILSECFWWVEESHRNGTAGARLLAEFKKRGETGYDWITLSLIENISPIKGEALEKRGFVKKETAFLMEV